MSQEKSKHSGTERFQRADFVSFLLVISLIIPALALIAPVSVRTSEALELNTFREKTVWCSLYTWYGVPGGPAGMWGLDAYQKNRSSQWDSVLSSAVNVSITNGTIKGEVDTQGTLVMLFNAPTARITKTRVYFELNVSTNTTDKGPMKMIVVSEGKRYSTDLINSSSTFNQNTFYIFNKVFPIHFTLEGNTTEKDLIGIQQSFNATGSFEFTVDYLQTSMWKHYDEDFHTYQGEDGYWFNDPPVHPAVAHRVYYDGVKWPEIPSYGLYNHSKWNEVKPEDAIQYGIYDSLDPIVIKAQLMLMEKAGIDVVQVMHPWSLEIFTYIMDIAKSINSTLKFFIYGNPDFQYVKDVMDIAYSAEYRNFYYYINSTRPVYNWGWTGLMEKPIQNYLEEIYYIRSMFPNIYIIGDVYSSPYLMREEYMENGFLDGWYYYDTSAFYRHGWGDPEIENYQADGTLLPFNRWGHLDRIFGSISTLAHSHGVSYTAIVIPGTDNTAVHGFRGSPMYDGRTGTINTRSNGLTYNRSWEAAIIADADHICIVSWNELHEGTEIEPTIQNGTYYIELTQQWSAKFKT
jgi:hypothetical protein